MKIRSAAIEPVRWTGPKTREHYERLIQGDRTKVMGDLALKPGMALIVTVTAYQEYGRGGCKEKFDEPTPMRFTVESVDAEHGPVLLDERNGLRWRLQRNCERMFRSTGYGGNRCAYFVASIQEAK